MRLQREKALANIIDYICKFSLDELIELWNYIFPDEEQICQKTFEGKSSKEIEMLNDELIMIIIDEISSYSDDTLSEVYSKIFDENEMEIIDEIEIEEF